MFLKGKENSIFSGQLKCDVCIGPNPMQRPMGANTETVVVLFLFSFLFTSFIPQ